MARMSIDEKARHDIRFKTLVRLCGWSTRETWGCLTDVWWACYDHKTEYLTEWEINQICLSEAPDGTPYDFGFAQKMIDVGLAKRVKKNLIRIAGAEERIAYLKSAKESGKRGGLKSAELRASNPKGRSRVPQGLPNPIPTPIPSSSPSADPDPSSPERESTDDGDDGEPQGSLSGLASPGGGGEHGEARPALRVVGPVDELVVEIAARHAEAHENVRTARGIRVPALDSPREAIRSLLDQIPLAGARSKCLHVIAVREAEANAKGTLRWFGAKIWHRGEFERSLQYSLDDVLAAKPPPRPPKRSLAAQVVIPNVGMLGDFVKSVMEQDDPDSAKLALELAGKNTS